MVNRWHKMTQADVQKYLKVFVQVDTDKDGKITGDQARSLFLSWKIPRAVLKQIWDLSDQDNDGMLSTREFCIALYLMERCREGSPLPATFPASIISDETLVFSTSNQITTNSNVAQEHTFVPHQLKVPSTARPLQAARPPRPPIPHVESKSVPVQPKVPVLEKHLMHQLSENEQDSLSSKFQEAENAEKKVEELEKGIMDSRQKNEFYRSKMQEIVLYKSKCDNRINETSQMISAERMEVGVLAKKYEEKSKKKGNLSKLNLEEATFRDIQVLFLHDIGLILEQKLELHQAILKISDADGKNLKEQAESLQSVLEELMRNVNGRCKQYGLRAKPTSLTELPFGWQPGILEAVADWDDTWDNFQDEGFSFVEDLTLDLKNVLAKPRSKPPIPKEDSAHKEEEPAAEDSISNLSGVNDQNNSVSASGLSGKTEGVRTDTVARTDASTVFGETKSNAVEQKALADGEEELQGGQGASGEEMASIHSGSSAPHPVLPALSPIKTGYSYAPSSPKESLFADSVPVTPASNYPRANSFAFPDSIPNTPYHFGSSPRSFSSSSHEDGFESFGARFDSPHKVLARFDSMHSTASTMDFGPTPNLGSRFDSFKERELDTTWRFSRSDSTIDTKHDSFENLDTKPGVFSRFDSFSEQGDNSATTSSSVKDHGLFVFDDTNDPFGTSNHLQSSTTSEEWRAF